jgi:hypothetical protein
MTGRLAPLSNICVALLLLTVWGETTHKRYLLVYLPYCLTSLAEIVPNGIGTQQKSARVLAEFTILYRQHPVDK